MITDDTQLQFRFRGACLGLSARRIWEHLNVRQVNPFTPITPRTRIRAEDYVDVINTAIKFTPLTGATLADVVAGRLHGLVPGRVERLLANVRRPDAQRWLDYTRRSIQAYTDRRSMRNVPAPFLPADHANPLGIQGLRYALLDWLKARRTERARAEQWVHRIDNLAEKGLRREELRLSGIEWALLCRAGETIDGDAVIEMLGYRDLRLSVLPMLEYSGRHVRFSSVRGDAPVKRIKPKLKRKLTTRPQWRDPVLGYWIDAIEWDDLLGKQRAWMAFTCRGQPLPAPDYGRLCSTPEEAMELADRHAKTVMPKMSTNGKWPEYRLTGGEQYREWLVTLPYFRNDYLDGHFDHRNVLLHVRCDIRETRDDERVLVLQEVQSDWGQAARRALDPESDAYGTVPEPPWLREWPALALKLMLLHAVHLGVAGLAWTPGSIQKERYGGYCTKRVIDLYDRTLPKAMNRLLRPHGRQCESVNVYQPVNFRIDPGESGYIVQDNAGERLGTAESWVGVQQLLPDGAHEVLTAMHGVMFDGEMRERIRREGFYAWGTGIH